MADDALLALSLVCSQQTVIAALDLVENNAGMTMVTKSAHVHPFDALLFSFSYKMVFSLGSSHSLYSNWDHTNLRRHHVFVHGLGAYEA